MRVPMPSMKFADWPEIDRALWHHARSPSGPFDEEGPAAGWAKSTLQTVEFGYGVWLTWLDSIGQLDRSLRPIERVNKERVRSFLEAYAPGRAPLSQAAALKGIARVVRCTEPPHGLVWLTKMADRMGNTRERARPKPPRMATIRELLDLGEELYIDGAFEMENDDEVKGAVALRDGLMILMLAARPGLRRAALCAMKLGDTAFIDEHDFWVEFPPELIKTRHRVRLAYPRSLHPYIERYLEEARPILLDNPFARKSVDEGWFWVNRRGRRVRGDYATSRIPSLIEERLGRRVSLHLFRDCAATDIALEDPEHVGIIKDVLQHTTLSTSYGHYVQAGTAKAITRYGDIVARPAPSHRNDPRR
jgi:integrase